MKTKLFTSLSFFLVLLTISATTLAQEKNSAATLSVETDPATFFFSGYALHVRWKPANTQHIVVGLGTYALDLPNLMVDLNSENKNMGWKVRINQAYSLFGEYYFDEANRRWFLGMQAGIQQHTLTNDNVSNQKVNYTSLLVMPSLGYNWRPFGNLFYVKPWMGVGYANKISGTTTVEDRAYEVSKVVPFMTLHVGYTFTSKK